MGMDVIGRKPTNEVGEYFRNNVWYWRPLWDYCNTIAPDLCDGVNGHYNDGDGLNEEGAIKLAEILFGQLESGETARYETEYREVLANLPRHDCMLCHGTGVRTDEIGVSMGMPTRELDEAVSLVVGRTHGYCNGCNGEGVENDWMTNYPFDVENVREFANFLRHSGGFQIW